jgi:hypothetical protein
MISIAMARAIRVVDGMLIDRIPRAALIAWSEISTLGDGGLEIRNLVNYKKEMTATAWVERITR